jgi:hypothetical protein
MTSHKGSEILELKLKNREQLIIQQTKEIEKLQEEIRHLKDDGPDWFYKTCVENLKAEIKELLAICGGRK